jgi:hypothetical protein
MREVMETGWLTAVEVSEWCQTAILRFLTFFDLVFSSTTVRSSIFSDQARLEQEALRPQVYFTDPKTRTKKASGCFQTPFDTQLLCSLDLTTIVV